MSFNLNLKKNPQMPGWFMLSDLACRQASVVLPYIVNLTTYVQSPPNSYTIFIAQNLVRDRLFERSYLIGLAQKEKYRVSFSVGIKGIISRHFEYCKYLKYLLGSNKYIVNRH